MRPVADLALVGRDSELQFLEGIWGEVRGGEGVGCVLAGEAGIGKTRLTRAFADTVADIGAVVLWGGCSEFDMTLPYLPFNEAIGGFLARSDPGWLAERLGPLAPSLATIVPAASIGSLPFTDPVEPATARLQLFEAVIALLRDASGDAPGARLLLVIEDAHWADRSTCELLDFILRRLRQLPVCVIVTYRHEELTREHPLGGMVVGWRRMGRIASIELGPLDKRAVSELICNRLDVDRVSDAFAFAFAERSDGVPFAVEELMEEAISSGHIFHRAGAWQRAPLAQLDLPATLAETIGRRLARLDPAEAHSLAAAAVLGRSFDPSAVAPVGGEVQTAIDARLQVALDLRLIETDPDNPGRLRFRHSLTHEAVLGELSRAERRRLHGLAADGLAATDGVPAVERARHLVGAGRAVEAAPLCLRAGDTAARAGAFAEAAHLYELALEGIDDPLERGRLLCRMGQIMIGSGQVASAAHYLGQGVQLLDSTQHRRELAQAFISLGGACWLSSDRRGAGESYERARRILEAGSATTELVQLYASQALWHNSDLDCHAGLALADRALHLAETLDSPNGKAGALIARGWALCELGRRDEGLAVLDAGTQAAMAAMVPEFVATGVLIGAEQRLFALRVAELSATADFLRTLNLGPSTEIFAALVGCLYYRAVSNCDALEREAQAVIDGAEPIGMDLVGWLGREFLAEARYEQGRLDEAESLFDDLSEREGQWQRTWIPGRIQVALLKDEPDRAAALARKLLERVPATARDPFTTGVVVPALLSVGAEQEASSVVSDLMTAEPRHPGALMAAGALYRYQGQKAAAAACFRDAADGYQAAGYALAEVSARGQLADLGSDDAEAQRARARELANSTGSWLIRNLVDHPSVETPGAIGDQQPPVDGSRSVSRGGLSPRELELLTLVARGKTDAQIANDLYISVSTVRSHLDRIRDKTGRRRRAELALYANELDLIS